MQSSVSNSKRVLEEAFQTGTAILGSMSGQRDRLKVSLWFLMDWSVESHAVEAFHTGDCKSGRPAGALQDQISAPCVRESPRCVAVLSCAGKQRGAVGLASARHWPSPTFELDYTAKPLRFNLYRCLQAAQRKVLDALNSAGLSESVLRVIDHS